MKKVIAWIKTTPITLLAGIFAIIALVLLFLAKGDKGEAKEAIESHAQKMQQIAQKGKETITLPPPNIDDEPRPVPVTINSAIIDHMIQLNDQMREDNRNLVELVLDANQYGGDNGYQHLPVYEDIFPKPLLDSLLFEVPERYEAAFREMFEPYSRNALYPHLDASPPLSVAEIQAELDVTRQQLLNSAFARTVNDLDPDELVDLRQTEARRKLELMKNHAEDIHVYAETTPGTPEYPFDVMQLAVAGDRPELEDVWQAQMELWVQQDIVEAVGLANRVQDRNYNVMYAPIKRLMSIKVSDGPVGILAPSMVGRGGGGGGAVADNFAASPTGRVSNNVYDVWHARVVMVVDIKKIPQIVEAFSSVNFMTILTMSMTDVDEYQALENGYVYGPGDAVELEMVVETVWFREWTTVLMPMWVKVDYGIMEAPEGEVRSSATGRNRTMQGMDQGMDGQMPGMGRDGRPTDMGGMRGPR